ncbi:outer membrane beta-barrel protein [Pedobacter sp. ASV12]|uniref:outer membrane beta-barrel protein n=1 Tax=Pedobacter sp. ASV12 TaxID=2795120 RepID=UPI0018EC8941|nr:outer membrane beta-barrel protein [Pedobacter sp. ASV12]
MKELNDKDFDQAFKTRVTEEYLQFEEESWLKMEKKLQKRDRMIWLRNASIILLFLSFGLGFFLFNRQEQPKQQTARNNKPKQTQKPLVEAPKPITELAQAQPIGPKTDAPTLSKQLSTAHQTTTTVTTKGNSDKPVSDHAIAHVIQAPANSAPMAAQPVKPVQNTELTDQQVIAQLTSPSINAIDTADNLVQKPKAKRKIPISLAISAGPDFNSTSALIGGKGTAAFGLTVGVGISKKITIQTGVIYGAKNYTASNYDYQFSNPNIKNSIAQINAACKVLEIPLRASYLLNDNKSRSLELNAGLSSYLMLKEDYVFKYTAASGKADRLTQKTNANQHFLSVLDLSATYNIKLNNKFGFGIEPYVKIPLGGIGEGSVPLKSSGVSLKLRYELNKK